MANPFSKSGAPLTPAQQALQQNATQTAQRYYNRWLPVQNFFVNSAQQQQPNAIAQAQGLAGSSARAAGANAASKLAAQNTEAGARPGSGRYVLGVQHANDATANAQGLGEASAREGAQARYAQALQAGLGMYQNDLSRANSTLARIGQNQAQEGALQFAQNQQDLQGLGQLAATAAFAV